jgi:DNA-binding NtrC family response regulator
MEYKDGPLRTEAYQKLKVFLKNPGRFCLIVVGSRGTGKHYSIKKAFDEIKVDASTESCLNDLVFIDAIKIPTIEDDLDNLFIDNENKTLVIEDVEELSQEQQTLLFKSLSTSNGEFGINKKVKIRVVFTSAKDTDSLREDGKYLTGLFWDRISQLIVEFPSYKQESANILKDFKSTWEKMDFKTIKEFISLSGEPKNSYLEKFLEDYADKFDGGFRDLDKIVCMYFNYRIYHYEGRKKIDENIEKEVLKSIKNDFFSMSQLQTGSEDDLSVFHFEMGLNHQDLLKKYKIQLRRWAVKKWQTVKKAEEKLGFKPGSMKNYVDKTVTSNINNN